MKRLICIVLGMLVACTLVLGGCGGNENSVGVPTVPASYQYDLSSNEDLRVEADLGGGTILSLKQGEERLEEGTDFTYAQNVIVINADYFKDFASGTTLSFQLTTTGGSASFTVQILQKETEPEPETKPVLLKDEYEFDLSYPEAVSLSVDLKGQTITGLIMGTTALTDTQYSYSAGILTIDISCFDGAAAGETFSFKLVTTGGSASFTVKVVRTYTPPAQKTTVRLWGYGDETEIETFARIVEEFNNTVGKDNNIVVRYEIKPEDTYSSIASTALSSVDMVDVVYIEDSFVKSWATNGYLEGLNDYIGAEEFTDGSVWEQGIQRYRYDVETATVTDSATLWALPKNLAPTVIYYNKEYIEQIGVTIISVPADQLDAFNAGSYVDGNGKTKTQYGINGTVKEKGYFELDGKWYFNNRVAMSWDETVALARAMMKEKLCNFGFYTDQWYSYLWSVGGNSISVAEDGSYQFTLGDTTPNYIVKDEYKGTLTIGKNAYSAGQIVSYADKTASGNWKEYCNQLPSAKDALLEFCSLSMDVSEIVGTKSDGSSFYGKGNVSMGETSLGTQEAKGLFSIGEIGMYVGGREDTAFLRETSSLAAGSWDVAPLPVYKEYDSDGEIIVHGISAGCSASVGLAIAENSKVKEEAWLFLRYVAGEEGQTALAESGLTVPNQIEIANSEVFLQKDQDPKNSIVFVEAAIYQTPSDWGYFSDNGWKKIWDTSLNYEVREGYMTVDKFLEKVTQPVQEELNAYTQKKS